MEINTDYNTIIFLKVQNTHYAYNKGVHKCLILKTDEINGIMEVYKPH